MKLHGFCLLNRFGVDIPYGKHDVSGFFGLSSILYNRDGAGEGNRTPDLSLGS